MHLRQKTWTQFWKMAKRRSEAGSIEIISSIQTPQSFPRERSIRSLWTRSASVILKASSISASNAAEHSIEIISWIVVKLWWKLPFWCFWFWAQKPSIKQCRPHVSHFIPWIKGHGEVVHFPCSKYGQSFDSASSISSFSAFSFLFAEISLIVSPDNFSARVNPCELAPGQNSRMSFFGGVLGFGFSTSGRMSGFGSFFFSGDLGFSCRKVHFEAFAQ